MKAMEPEPTLKELQSDFEKVIRRYQRPVLTFIFRMVNHQETAMDLCQEAFVKAYLARKRFSGKGKISTWLFAIAANHTRDYLRRKQLDTTSLHDEESNLSETLSSQLLNPGDEALCQEMEAHLLEALNRLPDSYREVVTLYHISELSVNDISSILKIPEGTVKNRLFRAREKLQQYLLDKWSES